MSEEIESRKVRKAPLEGAAVSALKLTSRGKPISKRSEPVDLWGDLFGLSRTMAVNSETWDLVPDRSRLLAQTARNCISSTPIVLTC